MLTARRDFLPATLPDRQAVGPRPVEVFPPGINISYATQVQSLSYQVTAPESHITSGSKDVNMADSEISTRKQIINELKEREKVVLTTGELADRIDVNRKTVHYHVTKSKDPLKDEKVGSVKVGRAEGLYLLADDPYVTIQPEEKAGVGRPSHTMGQDRSLAATMVLVVVASVLGVVGMELGVIWAIAAAVGMIIGIGAIYALDALLRGETWNSLTQWRNVG